MSPDRAEPRVALVVVAQSDYEHWDSLPQLASAADALVTALTSGPRGYDLHLRSLLQGGTLSQVQTGFDQWLRSLKEEDNLLVYWAGHGAKAVDGGHLLITKDSPAKDIRSINALAARALGEIIAFSRAQKILVLIDTCYSSGGAQEIGDELFTILKKRTTQAGQEPFVAVIPSSHALQKAQDGVFCRVLLDVLMGTNPPSRKWTDLDQFIDFKYLNKALVDGVKAVMGDGWQSFLSAGYGTEGDFLPNPRYVRRPATMDVETSRRVLQIPTSLIHAARGVEIGEAGSFFTGRARVLAHLNRMLQNPKPGLAIVTGSPGSGKSALLGRLLVDNEATGFVDAAVHARGKRVEDISTSIVEQIGDVPSADGTSDFVAALSKRPRPAVVTIDALDESLEPIGLSSLLRRLASEGRARVIVASRRSPDGHVLPHGTQKHERLRAVFGADAEIIDLDDEPTNEEDIAAYVRLRLAGSAHAAHSADVARAARNVAARAKGSFLYARIVTRMLADAPTLDIELPKTALDAFATDLRERFPDRVDVVDGLLRALAWAAGEGISRRTWPLLAGAVSQPHRTFSDDDVAWILDRAGWYILEAQEAGQAVYRLVHQSFADHYRSAVEDEAGIHRDIAIRLAAEIGGSQWLSADGYVARYFAHHASRGGVLDRFVADMGYLAIAEPSRLLTALPSLRAPLSKRTATAYRRVSDRIGTATPIERMALINLAAVQNDPELAPSLKPLLRAKWQARWARWKSTLPYTTLEAPPRTRDAAVLVELPGIGPALIYCTAAGLSGFALEQPALLANSAPILNATCLATCAIGGVPHVVVGTRTGDLLLVALPTFEVVARRPGAHHGSVDSLLAVPLAGQPCVASGGDHGAVALWQLPGFEPMTRREGIGDIALSLALATIDGQPALVVGSDAPHASERGMHAVSVWSLPALEPVVGFADDAYTVSPVCAVNVGNVAVVLGTQFGTAVGWTLPTGRPILERSRLPYENIDARSFLPLAAADDQATVAVVASENIRLLTLRRKDDGVAIEATQAVEIVRAEWLGPVSVWGSPYLVSVSDRIRLWAIADIMTAAVAAPAAHQLYRDQLAHWMISTASAGRSVWCGSEHGTVYCWDATTGVERLAIDNPPGRAVALAVVRDEGRQVLVGGFHSGVVQLFDPDTGVPAAGPVRVGKFVSTLDARPDEALVAIAVKDGDEDHHLVLRTLGARTEDSARTRHIVVPEWKDRAFTAVRLLHSPKGLAVAAAAGLSEAGLWLTKTGERIARYSLDHYDQIRTLTPCGVDVPTHIVAGTEHGALVAWALDGRSPLWLRDDKGIRHVEWMRWADRWVIATGGKAAALRLWSLSGDLLHEIYVGEQITAIVPLADGAVAIATSRGIVTLDVFGSYGDRSELAAVE